LYDKQLTVHPAETKSYQVTVTELVELLKNILQFDYEFVLSEDKKFGSPETNGSWNGLIKMLLDGVNLKCAS
jgi:hypothetical protein